MSDVVLNDAVAPSIAILSLEDAASLEESGGEKKEETVRVAKDGMTKQIDDTVKIPDNISSNHEPLPERNASRRTPLIHNLETLEEDHEMSHHDTSIIPQMNVYVLDDTPSVASSQPPLVLMKDSSAVMEESDDYHRTSRSPYKEPDTTLSLDKEEPVSDLDKSPPSDPEHRIHQPYNSLAPPSEMHISARADPDDHADDSSSSNDDSSYFASHLPEPNSGRRSYSFASNASSRPRKPADRESDASLSLSDDSDAGEAPPPALYAGPGDSVPHPHPYAQPYYQHPFPLQQPSFPTAESPGEPMSYPPQQQPPPHQFLLPRGVVPELYPQQQIMPPMHSYHSLASTSSQSDTSLPDVELQHDKSPAGVPSGRRSPILGEHPPSRRGGVGMLRSPSALEQPSPPTILHSFSNEGSAPHLAHPQPHTMAPPWAVMGMEHQRSSAVPSRESDFLYSGDSDNNNLYAVRSHAHHAFGEPQHLRSAGPVEEDDAADHKGFKVYWQRWLMLMYMSILNLLSDWTCYSVAPIALLTEEAFGRINAEQLVVVFLVANGIATACEPIILSRLGLRRTVLFGSLLLMIGSIVKSGGMPPIIQADLKKGQGEWRVYLGFFLVGLSQPLYQCTPALLSASWFPEAERTLATGVALNANQLGIGFAFIFGTMLVETSDDIPKYFSLLSILSTLSFLGTLIQFDDAPPTPPSDTAKVMRGTLEAKLPSVQTIFETVRNIGVANNPFDPKGKQENGRRSSTHKEKRRSQTEVPNVPSEEVAKKHSSETHRRSSRRSGGTAERRTSRRHGSGTARRRVVKKSHAEEAFAAHGPSPSPARWGPVRQPEYEGMHSGNEEEDPDGRVPLMTDDSFATPQHEEGHHPPPDNVYQGYGQPPPFYPGYPMYPEDMYGQYPPYPQQYPYPYWDPNYMARLAYFQQHPTQIAYPPMYPMPPMDPYGSYQHSSPYQPYPFAAYEPMEHLLPAAEAIDEGAEPVITIMPHHLDIHIRDDQIWLSTRACLARPGFVHSLVSFAVSGVVINTLSTFMDYLVRLNGAGREYTGIVGGTFQLVIMISSLIIGKVCDRTRAYYSITIGMLVLGAFGLAECGVSLDSNSGVSLRWSLIVVALLVGPLQPVSTELGVDVVYPLSENTVLVIQQLFSNLLSAAFIPCFKAMKDVGEVSLSDGATERPSYTFSFYLLIVVHACATVFFATFNGRYLRYEHELEKQAQEARRRAFKAAGPKRRDCDVTPEG